MTIKLERITNTDSEEVNYKIRKSFISSLLLTSEELKQLLKLIKKELGV